nr:MAG TPA: hypothetical protein [Caudoviricetes sp.]
MNCWETVWATSSEINRSTTIGKPSSPRGRSK